MEIGMLFNILYSPLGRILLGKHCCLLQKRKQDMFILYMIYKHAP